MLHPCETLARKLFFERYLDGAGAKHVQATVVTNSRALASLAEALTPSKSLTRGNLRTFVWQDTEAQRLAVQLGPVAQRRLEGAIGI